MKKSILLLSLLLGLSALNGRAQPGPGGNFDPAEMRQRMIDRYREMLEVKSDDEWKVVKVRVENVMTARRELNAGGMRMMGGGPGGGPPGGGPDGGGPDNSPGPGGSGNWPGPGGPGGPGMGPASSPEIQALQKAIDDKAGKDELLTKMASVREARKTKQAKLEQAQAELKKLLSVRQEAAAVVAGLLQ